MREETFLDTLQVSRRTPHLFGGRMFHKISWRVLRNFLESPAKVEETKKSVDKE
jgi:hypothetical protein